MNSKLFDNFAEILSAFIAKESRSITRRFNHMMNDLEGPWRALPEEFSVEMIQEHLSRAVVKDMTEKLAE